MDFHDKKVIPSKYIYLFMTLICLVLLFFSVLFENKISVLKTITSAIVTPMQSGINEVGTGVYNHVLNQKTKSQLLKENKELSALVDEYSTQLDAYKQKNYELKRLQELLGLKEQYAQYNTVGARVIATDSTNWFYTFLIDKGSDDGVRVGCNILAGKGLAGIVTEVGTNYAKVRAIVDDNSNISASVVGTDTLCTVSGDLALIAEEGYISVGYINKMDTIEEGAELVTSHVSDKFLPGLLIGYIADVHMDANNLTKSAKCIPVVDFRDLQEVLVVLELKAEYKTHSNYKNIFDNVSDISTFEKETSNEEDISGASSEEGNESSSAGNQGDGTSSQGVEQESFGEGGEDISSRQEEQDTAGEGMEEETAPQDEPDTSSETENSGE